MTTYVVDDEDAGIQRAAHSVACMRSQSDGSALAAESLDTFWHAGRMSYISITRGGLCCKMESPKLSSQTYVDIPNQRAALSQGASRLLVKPPSERLFAMMLLLVTSGLQNATLSSERITLAESLIFTGTGVNWCIFVEWQRFKVKVQGKGEG